jgi:hypothetical protein
MICKCFFRSVLDLLVSCWAHAYFEERPNLGACATTSKKATCKKRRKSCMQEEKPCGKEADKPNHVRVRVFDKGFNGYNPIK